MTPHAQLARVGLSAPAAGAIKVVLADDHTVMRRSLRAVLRSEQDISVVGEADSLPIVMRQLRGHIPDVVLLDLQAPNGSSIEAIRALHARAPDTAIVVLALDDTPAFVSRALRAGASGYVLKDAAADDLAPAIRAVATGARYLSERAAIRLGGHESTQDDGLSAREAEVLRLIALGYTNAETAEHLHLSTRTVETHRTRIHEKLGTTRRAQLVDYALRHHLIGG